MKKLFVFSIILLYLSFASSVFAKERVDSFDVTIRINQDSSIDFSEKIIYDFGEADMHGILRFIPIKYENSFGNYNLKISNISVTDEFSSPYKIKISQEGIDKMIKIGDPDVYVTGKKTYVINYTILRAITYFDTYDELYWNVTGNDWSVPILNASARVILPQSVSTSALQYDCFAGYAGSQGRCSSTLALHDERGLVGEVMFGEINLNANAGLTIVLGVPKGILQEPPTSSQLSDILLDNLVLFLPVIVFFAAFYLWYTRGRDPAGG